ncbi:MAG: hypothetical protein ACI93R_003624 [Flavobacteriales bacterium]|jgi:hypothetical protein
MFVRERLGFFAKKLALYSLLVLTLVALLKNVSAESPPSASLDASIADVDEVYANYSGFTQPMRAHHEEVIKAALDLSVAKYGPYTYTRIQHRSSPDRSFLTLENSKTFHVSVSTMVRSTSTVQHIMLPFYQGTHGLRSLVVVKKNLERFNSSDSSAGLRAMTAGMGAQWDDIKILEHNRIEVVSGPGIASVFAMLGANRFDYFPLGVIEAEAAIVEFAYKPDDLMVLPDVYLFYPIPFYVELAGHDERIRDRLRYGFSVLVETGNMKAIFEKNFGSHFFRIREDESTVFLLENPHIDSDANESFFDSIEARYFGEKTHVVRLNPRVEK